MCELELREATIHDADVAVELVTAMLHEMAAHGGRALNDEGRVRARLRERFLDALEKDDHVFLLAVVGGGGEPVGIVEASVRSTHEVFRPRVGGAHPCPLRAAPLPRRGVRSRAA